MSRYANILLASVAVAVLLLGGTFRQSAADPLNMSLPRFPPFLLGVYFYASFSSLSRPPQYTDRGCRRGFRGLNG